MIDVLDHQTLLGGAAEGREFIAAARGLFSPSASLKPGVEVVRREKFDMVFDALAHIDVDRSDEFAYATFLHEGLGAVTVGIMGDVDFIQLIDRPMPTIDQVRGIVFGALGQLTSDQPRVYDLAAA